MEFESLLNLFDSFWFEYEILKKQSHPPTPKTLEIPTPNIPTISTRSMDELVSSSSGSSSNSFSPNSILPRTLRPIFSGKESKDLLSEQDEEDVKVRRKTETPKRRRKSKKKGRLQRGSSKSLSDLEFQEIRGFMELGFVFSEEDKSSEFLATILPGLQRLGVEEKGSEMWKITERNKLRRRGNSQLTMSWEELPPVKSKIDMKDYLKSWAHTVASSVK